MSFFARAAEWQRAFSERVEETDATYARKLPAVASKLEVPLVHFSDVPHAVAPPVSPEIVACQALERATVAVRTQPKETTLAKAAVQVVARICGVPFSALAKVQHRRQPDAEWAARHADRTLKELQSEGKRAAVNYAGHGEIEEPSRLLRALALRLASVQRAPGEAKMLPFLVAPGCPGGGAYGVDMATFCERWKHVTDVAAVLVGDASKVSVLQLSGLRKGLFVAHRDMKQSAEPDVLQCCMSTLSLTEEARVSAATKFLAYDEVVALLTATQQKVDSWDRGVVVVFYTPDTASQVLHRWTQEANQSARPTAPIVGVPRMLPFQGQVGLKKSARSKLDVSAVTAAPLVAGFAAYGWRGLGLLAGALLTDEKTSRFVTWPDYLRYMACCMRTEEVPLLQQRCGPKAKSASGSWAANGSGSTAELFDNDYRKAAEELQPFMERVLQQLAHQVSETVPNAACMPEKVEEHYCGGIGVEDGPPSAIYATYEAAMQWLAYVFIGHKRGLQLQAEKPSVMVSRIAWAIAKAGREAAMSSQAASEMMKSSKKHSRRRGGRRHRGGQ